MNNGINRSGGPPALRWIRRAVVAFFVLLWAGGLFSYGVLGGPPENSQWAAPAFLFTAAAVTALTLMGTPGPMAWRLLLAGALAWGVEVLGVHTGFPFGGYDYSEVLKPAPGGAPLAIGAAWIALLGYTCESLRRWRVPPQWWPLAGAAWMTALDLVIDPPAAGPLGYWRWEGGGVYYGIPWTNFLGWFVLSAALMLLLPARVQHRVPTARAIGLSILLFFVLLNIRFGLILPAVVGVLLMAADLATGPDPRAATAGNGGRS